MKITSIKIVPAEGILVRDPITMEIIPKEGMIVPWTGSAGTYWRRRVKDKNVLIVKDLPKKVNEDNDDPPPEVNEDNDDETDDEKTADTQKKNGKKLTRRS